MNTDAMKIRDITKTGTGPLKQRFISVYIMKYCVSMSIAHNWQYQIKKILFKILHVENFKKICPYYVFVLVYYVLSKHIIITRGKINLKHTHVKF